MLVMCIGREIIFGGVYWEGREISVGDGLLGGRSLLVMFIGREIIVGDVHWEGDHYW